MTGDLPSGEIPGSQAAEVPEDFPSGKRSRTAAKEEDVDIQNAEEQQEKFDKKFHKASQRMKFTTIQKENKKNPSQSQ